MLIFFLLFLADDDAEDCVALDLVPQEGHFRLFNLVMALFQLILPCDASGRQELLCNVLAGPLALKGTGQ